MILVERELVVFQEPTVPTRALESLRPISRSYDLVRSLLRSDAGERPTYVQNFRVGATIPPANRAKTRADEWARTTDPLITSELLES